MPAPRTDTPTRTPWRERLLGYGPALAIVALAGLAWARVPLALEAGRVWSAAILIFLAGVARGLSFFTQGGPRWGQLASLAPRFWLGVAGLLALAWRAFA